MVLYLGVYIHIYTRVRSFLLQFQLTCDSSQRCWNLVSLVYSLERSSWLSSVPLDHLFMGYWRLMVPWKLQINSIPEPARCHKTKSFWLRTRSSYACKWTNGHYFIIFWIPAVGRSIRATKSAYLLTCPVTPSCWQECLMFHEVVRLCSGRIITQRSEKMLLLTFFEAFHTHLTNTTISFNRSYNNILESRTTKAGIWMHQPRKWDGLY